MILRAYSYNWFAFFNILHHPQKVELQGHKLFHTHTVNKTSNRRLLRYNKRQYQVLISDNSFFFSCQSARDTFIYNSINIKKKNVWSISSSSSCP